jgi:hypothetical protein
MLSLISFLFDSKMAFVSTDIQSYRTPRDVWPTQGGIEAEEWQQPSENGEWDQDLHVKRDDEYHNWASEQWHFDPDDKNTEMQRLPSLHKNAKEQR